MKRLTCFKFFVFSIVVCFLSFIYLLAQSGSSDNKFENEQRLVCAGMGYQNGYLDGYEIGYNDYKYHGRTDISTYPLYQKAGRGFNEKWIYKIVYQRAYRKGFQRGYEDGYYRRENIVITRFSQLENLIAKTEVTPIRHEIKRREGPIILPAGTTVILQLNDYLTTKMNIRGDKFTAITARDVFVGDELAIPQGTVIEGTVGRVKRPGRIKGKAEMSLRFTAIKFNNGTELPFSATLTGVGSDEGEIMDREGTVKGKGTQGKDAKVIAGTAGAGTIIGAIAAGGKGGLVGATIGGLAGLAGILSTRGKDIELPKGTLIEVMLDRDLKIEPLRWRRHE